MQRFEEISLSVRNRDAGRCRRCEEAEGDVRLSVHHLVPDSRVPDEYDAHLPVNLVSLCRSCHSELESRSLDAQLRILDLADREELMLSEAERNALNMRLNEVGPDELTVKAISKVESMKFIGQDFTDDDSQRGLSEF
ncbi:HNH endonuclease [Halorubrum saccharovorum]|uniref:HNH endonuclease n=1 Tax=Halorubrum saccharovorum TaxID=2248 RepID=UPI00135F151C|nr:HNH endonuclease signature motif containing protein [Halorubrum saccharovorum]